MSHMQFQRRSIWWGRWGTCPTNNSSDESTRGYMHVTDMRTAAYFSQMLLLHLRRHTALPNQPCLACYTSEFLFCSSALWTWMLFMYSIWDQPHDQIIVCTVVIGQSQILFELDELTVREDVNEPVSVCVRVTGPYLLEEAAVIVVSTQPGSAQGTYVIE